MYTLIIIICTILFLILGIILPTIFLFKRTKIKPVDEVFKLKYFGLYCLITFIYLLTFLISASIYLYNLKIIDSCGYLCQNYTNSPINIIVGLSIHLINSLLFYTFSKKTIIKFHTEGSKLKYLIISIFTIMLLCIFFLSYYAFGSFLGKFIINNIILNIIRWVIIFLPLFIYSIDTFIITNIRKKIIRLNQ